MAMPILLLSMAMPLLLLSITVLPLLLVLMAITTSKNGKPFRNGENLLPPSQWPCLPLIGNLFWHYPPTVTSLTDALRRLHAAHGPVVSLWVGKSQPAIFISCHDLAHRALVRMGTTFAHRPAASKDGGGLNSHAVNSATYGGRWGRLRRNLCSHLAAARVEDALRLSSDRLVTAIESAAAKDGGVVAPLKTFRHAVFGFFAALCFGEGADEEVLGRLRDLHAEIISLIVELDAFQLVPAFLQVVWYLPRWRKLLNAQRTHRALVTTLIGACRMRTSAAGPRCYVDTLLGLELEEDEMVSLCWEYMNASVKTTTTALEWIMARLVLHQDIQQKLRNDMLARRASGDHGHHMTCGEQQRPFVEAVVLEALRLHPPAHYLLAHTTDEDVSLGKYVIPKGSIVNFGVAAIGRDESLWTDPDVFRPERFLVGGEGSGVHCTGGGGGSGPEMMKMIPFGAGRRACPGAAVAMTVLQSFVDDLVMRFEWKWATDCAVGEHVDMTEKLGIITEMKVPLQAHLVVRQNSE